MDGMILVRNKRMIIMLLFFTFCLLVQRKYYHTVLKANLIQEADLFSVKFVDTPYQRAPVNNDCLITSQEDKLYLTNVLQQIFPMGFENTYQADRAIEIMKFVTSSLKLRNNNGTATQIIKDGYAICGGMSYTFIILCRKTGMPARYVGSIYTPRLSSHAIAEVFYDGGWHLFDPTFGIFFYSASTYNRRGNIASLHEFIAQPDNWKMFKVVAKPWVKKYDESIRNFAPILAEEDYLEEKYSVSVMELYREGIRASFPFAYGSNDLVSYPVDADLRVEKEQWYGERNDSAQELAEYANRFSGSNYLGGNSPAGYHTWLVKAPKNSRLIVKYFAAADDYKRLQFVPLRSIALLETVYEKRQVSFTIYNNDEEGIFAIYCPNGTFSVDAMSINVEPN